MEQPKKDQGEGPTRVEAPREAEARRIIQEYIDHLRELIRRLRGKLH